ncbi:DUF3054 domain-containing protein [Myceligenerans crystallogenes]|uniref:DUF3054 domain-containing protein n=1 Tax=Myceligenerans crystallogenes TaxID=316335 RepID=A0ABN2N5N0_9MICO
MTVSDGAPGRVPVAPAIVADAVAVLTFAIIGMNTHGTLLLELGRVVWPFAVGAAAGWAWTRAWRDPSRLWPAGVCIWFTTVIVGMILRIVTGGAFVPTFLLVTTLFLGITMLGWRALVTALRRNLDRRSEA